MDFSRFFIDRPIFAAVMSIIGCATSTPSRSEVATNISRPSSTASSASTRDRYSTTA